MKEFGCTCTGLVSLMPEAKCMGCRANEAQEDLIEKCAKVANDHIKDMDTYEDANTLAGVAAEILALKETVPEPLKPQDWRVGLSCKPKYRTDIRRYDGNAKIVGVEPNGTNGIVDDDGVLRIEQGGRTFLSAADEWMTA